MATPPISPGSSSDSSRPQPPTTNVPNNTEQKVRKFARPPKIIRPPTATPDKRPNAGTKTPEPPPPYATQKTKKTADSFFNTNAGSAPLPPS